MSDEDKESGSFPTSSAQDEAPENEAGQTKSQHKVIADIHSGMVLVAPVGTDLQEDENRSVGAPPNQAAAAEPAPAEAASPDSDDVD